MSSLRNKDPSTKVLVKVLYSPGDGGTFLSSASRILHKVFKFSKRSLSDLLEVTEPDCGFIKLDLGISVQIRDKSYLAVIISGFDNI